MKALALMEPKSNLAYIDRPEPKPLPGEQLVEIYAAALNRRDYWITQGMYPGVQTPCILGSDGAGKVGDREVILCPSLNWGDSEKAQGPNYQILGMPRDGTFAERIAYPETLIYDKPAHLSFEAAAALPLAGLTAYRALMVQGELQPGQKLLISGIGGGVATFALSFALAHGVEVFVSSSSDEKIQKALELGAKAGVKYTEKDWRKQFLADQGPVDLVLDSAGGSGYNDLLKILKPGGAIVNYGATAGPPAQLDMFTIFWNQIRIVGSTMGSQADFKAMLDFVTKHEIQPQVDQVVPLSEGSALVQSMAEMQQFGKLVLRPY